MNDPQTQQPGPTPTIAQVMGDYADQGGMSADTTTAPAPVSAAPDVSNLPANTRPAPSPAQVTPPPKRSVMSDILHAVGDVLGGPSTVKRVNPQTGAIENVPLSREGRIANTAGIYLRGAAAGAAQHGPAAAGKAALAGVTEEQETEEIQNKNVLDQSKNAQDQLRDQAAIVLTQHQIAESGWRMAREGTEIDSATADKFNTMQGLLSSDPSNTYLAHFDSFADMLRAHPQLTKAGFNIPALQSQGLLRAVVTTAGGKSTGVDVYKISPQWLDMKTEDAIKFRQAVGLDSDRNPIYQSQEIPARAITNRDALNYLGVSGKNELDAQEKAIQLQNQSKETNAQVSHLNAETNLAQTQARSLISSQQADPFGYTSPLPQKEALKRSDSFQKDVVNKAYDTEKAYQMSQQALSEYQDAAKQGKTLPTGAQSMLLLSQHLGTTFGNVKGSRITKDMIQEHLGARGISDDAQTAIQRVVNGDQLSPAQWKAFTDLISQSRSATWNNAVSNAKNQQLPITFLPRGNGQRVIDRGTAQIYLDTANGDLQAAANAMKRQGWVLPTAGGQ